MEQAGGRVAPMNYSMTDAKLYPLLDKINGVLWIGGAIMFYDNVTNVPHPFTVITKKIFEYSMKLNDKGEVFPLWGTC